MATTCTVTPYGKFDDGREIYCYTLTDEKGQYVSMMNVGCTFLDIKVLDKDGNLVDVNLGYNTLEKYLELKGVMGATIGRVANRIANGKFTLNGKEYTLLANERGMNMLHSGGGRNGGYQAAYWDGSVEGDTVTFTIHSPDGESGFPGNLTATETVTFRDGKLTMEINSTCDQDTIVNFTNHAYYNLNGHDNGTVLDHTLTLSADLYSECGPNLIPVKAVSVTGTPFDFTTPHTVGERIYDDFKQIRDVNGYDVNYVLRSGEPAARMVGGKTGIVMEVYTNAPDMQFFSGIGLTRTGEGGGKNGATYQEYSGFCLEPHAQPDAINSPVADQVILRAGEKKTWCTTLAFSVEK